MKKFIRILLAGVLSGAAGISLAHADGNNGGLLVGASGGPVAIAGGTLYYCSYNGGGMSSIGTAPEGRTFSSVAIAYGGPIAAAGDTLYLYGINGRAKPAGSTPDGAPITSVAIAYDGPIAAAGDTLYKFVGSNRTVIGTSGDGTPFTTVAVAYFGPIAIAGDTMYQFVPRGASIQKKVLGTTGDGTPFAALSVGTWGSYAIAGSSLYSTEHGSVELAGKAPFGKAFSSVVGTFGGAIATAGDTVYYHDRSSSELKVLAKTRDGSVFSAVDTAPTANAHPRIVLMAGRTLYQLIMRGNEGGELTVLGSF